MTSALPPWYLTGDGTGDGYIWLFKFPRGLVQQNGFLADWQLTALGSTLGAVMLIDYRQSDVGPYRELLFMPGRMRLAGRSFFSVSKIYVSTQDSVASGIENWGIPKQLVAIERVQAADGSERFSAVLDGREFFNATLEPFGLRFPFSSALIPEIVSGFFGSLPSPMTNPGRGRSP